ncbi:MAG: VOC family protein [Armatimonadetes bacterium]|nr:VOC family protein [Armatimonadota bacterium]
MLPISRIILFVRDPDTVANFYQKHFGLQLLEGAEKGWIELSAGGCTLALHRANRPADSIGSIGHSPTTIVFGVQDVHAAKASFAANGLKFGKVYESADFAFANAKDPEGNRIQLSSRGM